MVRQARWIISHSLAGWVHPVPSLNAVRPAKHIPFPSHNEPRQGIYVPSLAIARLDQADSDHTLAQQTFHPTTSGSHPPRVAMFLLATSVWGYWKQQGDPAFVQWCAYVTAYMFQKWHNHYWNIEVTLRYLGKTSMANFASNHRGFAQISECCPYILEVMTSLPSTWMMTLISISEWVPPSWSEVGRWGLGAGDLAILHPLWARWS